MKYARDVYRAAKLIFFFLFKLTPPLQEYLKLRMSITYTIELFNYTSHIN